MASSTLRFETEAGAAGGGVLPTDAIYEILIHLPAEELCRLRVVCRPWRSLLSDPQFAAHAARHQQGRPLIVVTNHGKSFHRGDDDGILCRIVDLSGRIIKLIPAASEDELLLLSTSTHRNLAASIIVNHCQLLNLATGERFPLPEELSPEHAPRRLDVIKFYTLYKAFGQVASTGELKVVRVIDSGIFKHLREQLWEVFTLGDARWRGKKAPQHLVEARPLSTVAIDGVVYFLLYNKYVINGGQGIKAIASFELQTEEWRLILQGPASIPDSNSNICLVALNGSLVLVHCWPSPHFLMDLWFLMDFDKGLWLKQHSVEFKLGIHVDFFDAHPLVILKNGVIVIHIRSTGSLTIYNPKTNTYTDVGEIGFANIGIGLYTGNLLSLTNDDAI